MDELLEAKKYRTGGLADSPYGSWPYHALIKAVFKDKNMTVTPQDVAFVNLCLVAALQGKTLAGSVSVEADYSALLREAKKHVGEHVAPGRVPSTLIIAPAYVSLLALLA